jgi:hypothetical protein
MDDEKERKMDRERNEIEKGNYFIRVCHGSCPREIVKKSKVRRGTL